MKHNLFKLGRVVSRFKFITKPLIKILLFSLIIFTFVFIFQKANVFIKKQGLSGKDLLTLTKKPEDFLDHTDGRTNFLLLGLRGEGSEAIDLTDTMIVVSYQYDSNSISLISIPRDLWVNSLKTKINAVYHYGNLKQPNGGFALTNAAIQETLGLPIHYITVVNFRGFVETVDLLGGLEIDVQNGFIDQKFPIPGKEDVYPESDRYQTIEFVAGSQIMDGEMALKFVRSRNAEGSEGTDFARSKRQQQILTAIRSKIFSTKTVFNQEKITALINIINSNIITNITADIYPPLLKLLLIAKDAPIIKIPLSSEKNSTEPVVLETPQAQNYQNQWVLIAKDNNWDALKLYISNKLKGIQ